MSDYVPELGQMAFSNSEWFELPLVPEIEAGLSALAHEVSASLDQDPYRDGLLTDNCGGEFANDVFAMRAYCWCDEMREGHENGCPPNFEHFASGFKVSWYKYLGRGSSQNANIKRADWFAISRDCSDSLKPQEATQSTTDGHQGDDSTEVAPVATDRLDGAQKVAYEFVMPDEVLALLCREWTEHLAALAAELRREAVMTTLTEYLLTTRMDGDLLLGCGLSVGNEDGDVAVSDARPKEVARWAADGCAAWFAHERARRNG